MTTKRSELLAALSQEFEVVTSAGTPRQPPRASPFAGHDGEVGVIGSVVEDLYLQPIPGQPTATKITCTRSKRRGGAEPGMSLGPLPITVASRSLFF